MADATKYIPINSDPKSFFSIPKTRKTLTFAYAFTFAFVAFTVFLAFCPSPNSSSPFFTNIFSSTASSTSSTTAYKSQLSSIFSFLFNTTTSSSSSSNSSTAITHGSTTSRSTNTTFQSPPTSEKPFKATPFQNHTQTTPTVSKIPTNHTAKPRDRVVNKEPSSASNHTRVSGTSYEDKALNKSNHSSNGVASAPKVSGGSPRENLSSPVKGEGVVHSNYTASLVKKKKNGNKEMDSGVEDEKIEALIKCDFFDGEWIKDYSYPLYAPGSCNLIDEQFSCIQNGRPDKDYQKYKWKPKGCSLPRLDGNRMLEMLRGKRLIFVGDSLNRNMWESLICILRNSVKDKSKVYEANGRVRFKGEASYSFIFKDYNFSAELFVSPFLVQEWQVQVKNGTKKETLRLDLVGKSSVQYKNADIIIFNTGHWWTHDKTSKGKDYYQEGSHVYNELNVLEAFRRAITTWSRWIDASIDSSKSMIFFRGYSASHFSGGQWNSGGQCDSETVPIKNDKYLKEYPPKMRVLEKVLKYMKTKVTYLNVTKMTDFRKDGHPSIYRKQNLSAEERKSPLSFQDCSHWCLPGVPDAWNEILYAELLLRQYQNQHLKNRT
ncbi:Protein trichome birefringence [Vigna angularis]|uniref:Protein trichome birefringence n=2 Tax=Phaseolus angularis TaxID=3914 RepID=A0A8T0KTC9_PHAAN|nr:protein trichome birefringence [Vigna angularis]KAG2403480.1 Protein trichome birefringence [Vigna angularis]